MKYERLTDSETAEMLKNTEGECWNSEDIEVHRYIRLAELEDKIEDGRIIELPCKIGDPTYTIITKRWKRYLDPHSFILKTKLTYYNIPRVLSRFGKTIFLTKKEAEARMKEIMEK